MPQRYATETAVVDAAAGVDTDSTVAPDTTDLESAREWITTHCRPGAELEEGGETVEILRSLGMDEQGLLVGLLQPLLPISDPEGELIAKRFGASTMTLLQGADRMRQLSALSSRAGNALASPSVNEENLRKMLITMVDDVRVVLIELARHLALLRRQVRAPESAEAKQALGRLTLEVYAPLANRLGVRQLKWRMEDLSLRCMQPTEYRELASALDETRLAREQYIGDFTERMRSALQETGVVAEVYGRPKHLFSIWKKMQRKGLAFADLRDIRALRILVDGVADCYAALALVHARWPPLAGEFDDYIATPKANGYRSIHSVVRGPGDKPVEVQIRTREMHRQSEYGVAAHWRYKENVRADDGIDGKVRRLRQLLEWKAELPDAGDVGFDSNADANTEAADDDNDANAKERVYVFTPRGAVMDLPAGATPIDFAYAVHTEIGHRTRGALVNGKMTPLSRPLQTGDQVVIHTVKSGQPSRDWLRADLGYVRTRRARARIARWFKHADHDQHLAEGRAMLERELSRLGREDLGYDKIARAAGYRKTDDLLAALGAGDCKLSRALASFRTDPASDVPATPPASLRKSQQPRPASFRVNGVGNLLTRMAHCCNPIPGDSIVGFITAGRGVSIHRRNCNNMRNMDAARHERLVEVEWGERAPASWPVDIHLLAHHRAGLLNDITQLLKDEKAEALKLTLTTDDEQNAHIQLRLETSGLEKLNHVLRRLQQVPNVLRVRRAAS